MSEMNVPSTMNRSVFTSTVTSKFTGEFRAKFEIGQTCGPGIFRRNFDSDVVLYRFLKKFYYIEFDYLAVICCCR